MVLLERSPFWCTTGCISAWFEADIMKYTKGQYSVSAAIISVLHIVLTVFSSLCLRNSFAWKRDEWENINSTISLCSWWSSALVLSTEPVQQLLNQPTGICEIWAEGVREPREETKPLVYGAGLRLRRCGRPAWVTDLHCWFSLSITLSVCTSFSALCSCCSCFLSLGYVCHGGTDIFSLCGCMGLGAGIDHSGYSQ